MEIRYFDAAVYFGKDAINHDVVNHERFIVIEKVVQAVDAPSLIEYMDYVGIEMALVGHRAMMEQDAVIINLELCLEHESVINNAG